MPTNIRRSMGYLHGSEESIGLLELLYDRLWQAVRMLAEGQPNCDIHLETSEYRRNVTVNVWTDGTCILRTSYSGPRGMEMQEFVDGIFQQIPERIPAAQST